MRWLNRAGRRAVQRNKFFQERANRWDARYIWWPVTVKHARDHGCYPIGTRIWLEHAAVFVDQRYPDNTDAAKCAVYYGPVSNLLVDPFKKIPEQVQTTRYAQQASFQPPPNVAPPPLGLGRASLPAAVVGSLQRMVNNGALSATQAREYMEAYQRKTQP